MSEICEPLDDILSLVAQLKNSNMPTRRVSGHDSILDQISSCVNKAKNNIIKFLFDKSEKTVKPPIFTDSTNNGTNKKKSYSTALTNTLIVPISEAKPETKNVLNTEKSVTNILKANNTDATIKNISATNNGNVLIRFNKNDDIKPLMTQFQTSLGKDVKLKLPRWPKIKIVGVNEEFLTNDKAKVTELIANENKFIHDAISNHPEHLEYIFSYTSKSGKTLICRCSPSLRKLLQERHDVIRLEYRQCKIYNHTHIQRCSKCCGFDHYKTHCKKNTPCCTFCAQAHSHENCPSKNNSTEHKCFNCLNSTNDLFVQKANTHNAFSSDCPILKHKKESISASTDWGTQL